jgi:hypothetical protein
MPEKPPSDTAEQYTHTGRDRTEQYCTIRMAELGIPIDKNGAPDFDHDRMWRAFDSDGRSGGNITSGVYLNSGVLSPDLLKGGKGGRIWPKARLRD